MEPTAPFTVQLDAVNHRGRPVLGVTYSIRVDGVTKMTAQKTNAGYQTLSGTVPTAPVAIEASLPGWETQTIRLGPGTSKYRFTFRGAGIPEVLIVCALAKETRAVLDTCDASAPLPAGHAPSADFNKYWVGEYRSGQVGHMPRRVLVATSGMGTIGAAITATHALRSFPDDITQILMVGIAGGCPNHRSAEDHVRLGDIVVANERGVIQYDFIKKTVNGAINRSNPHRPSAQLMQAAQSLEIRRQGGAALWEDVMAEVMEKRKGYRRPARGKDVMHVGTRRVDHPKDPERRRGWPRVHRGAIGSANILLKDPKLRDAIRDTYGVRAVEMEGSGVMDAGWAVNKDIMVVRGICDYADAHKSDDWQAYAALAAASYTRCLVMEL